MIEMCSPSMKLRSYIEVGILVCKKDRVLGLGKELGNALRWIRRAKVCLCVTVHGNVCAVWRCFQNETLKETSQGNQEGLKGDVMEGMKGLWGCPPLALEQEATSTLTTWPLCCCHPICRWTLTQSQKAQIVSSLSCQPLSFSASITLTPSKQRHKASSNNAAFPDNKLETSPMLGDAQFLKFVASVRYVLKTASKCIDFFRKSFSMLHMSTYVHAWLHTREQVGVHTACDKNSLETNGGKIKHGTQQMPPFVLSPV